jgi:hypothetical protein
VQLEYALTLAEYRRAHDLFFKTASFRKRLNYRLTTRVAPWAAIFLFLGSIDLFLRHGDRGPAIATLLVSVILAQASYAYHSSVRRLHRKLPKLFSTTVTEQGIADRDRPMVPWSSTQGTIRSNDLILILLGPGRFLPLPRRIFSPEQAALLDGWLAEAHKTQAA